MDVLPFDRQGLAVITGSRQEITQHRRNLTLKYYDVAEQEERIVHAYLNIAPTQIGVPRSYALHGYADVSNFEVEGQSMEFGPPGHVDLRPKQVAPVEELVKGYEVYYDQMLQAPTRSGKTVMGCEIAVRLGKCTLILVDQNKLMSQWEVTLTELFGYGIDEIGIVQGKICEYYMKDFTIGMIQSIYDREFPDDFYSQFGFVIFDEYHVCGADQYSAVLSMFPAENRLAMSATDRNDAKQKLIDWHVCQNKVVMEDARKPSQVRYVEYDGEPQSWYAQISPKDGRYVSEIAADPVRNELVVSILMRLYEMGRKVLVIGARIHQLESIREICIALGMSVDDTVLYTGSESTWKWKKNPTPNGHPEGYDVPEEGEEGAAYTPIHFVLHEKKVNLAKRDADLYTRQVIFSTYSVFSKGVDVPDIDAGLDVTPKTTFVQVHGRVLTQDAYKLVPIWVTIRDINSFRAEYQFGRRIGEFTKSNAEIYLWNLNKGIKPVTARKIRAAAKMRNALLKGKRISTDAGGRNTVQIGTTGRQ